MSSDEKIFIPIHEKYNCQSNEELTQNILEILKDTPLRNEAVQALENIPNSEVPELFVSIMDRVNAETEFVKKFRLDEIFTILSDPEKNDVYIEKNGDGQTKGKCAFNGEIGLYHDDISRTYSERLRHLVSRGTLGTSTIEHENGHHRVFSPIEDPNGLKEFILSKIDEFKNRESYAQAVELHEVYARLCTVEECCGSYDWSGGPDDIFENRLYNINTWIPYGIKKDSAESPEKVRYAVTSILVARMFFSEQEIADAVSEHGEWDTSTKTYPGIEKLISKIPREDRDYLAENTRLSAQLERLKAINIARKAVLSH